MDSDYLQFRLNRWAKRKHYPATTVGVFADWREAKVITTPPKQGRRRNWTVREYRRASEIVRLKQKGVADLGTIRLLLWLKFGDVPLLQTKFDDREILERCFLQFVKKMKSSIHSDYPGGKGNASDDGYSARSVVRGMGELDACFFPFVEYAHLESLELFRLSVLGQPTSGHMIRPMKQIVQSLLKSFGVDPRWNVPDAVYASDEFKSLPGWISGLFSGSASPVLNSIHLASPEQFEAARQCQLWLTEFFYFLGLPKVAYSLARPEWRPGTFALLLHVIFLTATESRPKGFVDAWVTNTSSSVRAEKGGLDSPQD